MNMQKWVDDFTAFACGLWKMKNYIGHGDIPTCYGMFISGTFWGGLRVWVLKYFGIQIVFERGLEVV